MEIEKLQYKIGTTIKKLFKPPKQMQSNPILYMSLPIKVFTRPSEKATSSPYAVKQPNDNT